MTDIRVPVTKMLLTNNVLDEFISPHLSELTKCGAPPLPERNHRLPTLILQSILGRLVPSPQTSLLMNVVRHVDHAALSYDAGRASLLEYVGDDPGRQVTALYRALTHFETHIAHLNIARWQTMRVVFPDRKNLFEADEWDFDQRLQEINNTNKHLHEVITRGELFDGRLLGMWITNDGLRALPSQQRHAGRDLSVTFGELVEHLIDCYGVIEHVHQQLTSVPP